VLSGIPHSAISLLYAVPVPAIAHSFARGGRETHGPSATQRTWQKKRDVTPEAVQYSPFPPKPNAAAGQMAFRQKAKRVRVLIEDKALKQVFSGCSLKKKELLQLHGLRTSRTAQLAPISGQ
jgi:hypothetical protein